jgi:excisionase family DNA binding protein
LPASTKPPNMAAPELLTVAQAARALVCSEAHIRLLIRAGELPAFMLGRTYRIKPADLGAWIEAQLKEQTADNDSAYPRRIA